MNGPSLLTDALFILIVVLVAAFFVTALLKTAPADGSTRGGQARRIMARDRQTPGRMICHGTDNGQLV